MYQVEKVRAELFTASVRTALGVGRLFPWCWSPEARGQQEAHRVLVEVLRRLDDKALKALL